MERMLADYEKAHGLRWMALRYFNAAGCDPDGETGEWHEPETHLIPRALMAAAGKIPHLEIFGDDYPTPDGTCIRDYVHVSDLADAHVRGMHYLQQENPSLSLNLGTGTGFSVWNIITSIRNTTGHDVHFKFTPRREGDPAFLISNNDNAVSILGWQTNHSNIETLVRTAWKWQQIIQKIQISTRKKTKEY
jgi:UDP-glucose 4-epimerase